MLVPRLGLLVGQSGFDIRAGRGGMDAVVFWHPEGSSGSPDGGVLLSWPFVFPLMGPGVGGLKQTYLFARRELFLSGEESVWSTYITTLSDGFECIMIPCFLHGAGRHWGFMAKTKDGAAAEARMIGYIQTWTAALWKPWSYFAAHLSILLLAVLVMLAGYSLKT